MKKTDLGGRDRGVGFPVARLAPLLPVALLAALVLTMFLARIPSSPGPVTEAPEESAGEPGLESQTYPAPDFSRQMLARIDVGLEDADRTLEAHDRWGAIERDVEEGETGRRLAARREAVQLYLSLRSEARPSREEIVAVRATLEDASRAIRMISSQPDRVADWTESVEVACSWLKAANARTSQSIRMLNAMLTRCLDRSKLSLEEAVRELEVEEAESRARVVSESRRQANEEMCQALAAAERRILEVRRQAAEHESARILEAERRILEVRRQAAEHESARILEIERSRVEEARRRARQAEAERVLAMGTNRILLAPFITAGRYNPATERQESEPRPISYSFLRTSGALEPTTEGMERLLFYGLNPGDRPRWSYPSTRTTIGHRPVMQWFIGSQLAEVRSTQEILRSYGPEFVSLGLLHP